MPAATTSLRRGKIYRKIVDVESLRKHLEWAIDLEFATIPPYLTAQYSIQDKTSMAYRTIRSVVIEEMLHLNLACNLLNSIGGTPRLTGDCAPSFPGYMRHHATGGPYLQLMAASRELMQTTFMAIEQPAAPSAPTEGDYFQTIGQFYEAIRDGFEYCDAHFPDLFPKNTIQPVNLYVGDGDGKPIAVTDLSTALAAIDEIVEQGEGAELPSVPLNPDEPFANYDHYGQRVDGTFGPIVGSTLEMSHYFKFKKLADGQVAIGPTYPMAPNPSIDRFEWGVARALASIFNGCYSGMLRMLEAVFTQERGAESFYAGGFPLMQSVLPRLAVQLMRTPVSAEVLVGGNSALGPTAGPPFVYVDDGLPKTTEDTRNLIDSVRQQRDQCGNSSTEYFLLLQIERTLTDVARTLSEICYVCQL